MTEQQLPDRSEFVYEETVVEYVDNRNRRSILAAVLVLLFFLLLGLGYIVLRLNQAPQAPKKEDLPEGIGWVRSIYSYGTTADSLMDGPVSADVAPDGTIWVSTNRNVLASFSPNGQVQNVISPPLADRPGHFMTIEGLAVADNGDVYVCDSGRNAVMVFNEDGEYQFEWKVELPQEIDVKGDTVALSASAGIGLFTLEGDLIVKWGQRGSEEADFDLPHGVVLGDDGNVYVSDTQNHRIKAYSREGRLLWIKASPAKDSLSSQAETEVADGVIQNMQVPAGMTFDAAGRLLLVDPFEFQVLVSDVDNEGQIVERYGRYGQPDGRFAYPTDISYDPVRDWFVIADTANNRVQIIRLPGSGGSALRGALARFGDQPWWLCLIPLLLLLAAIVVWVTRRRRVREKDNEEIPAQEPQALS